MKGFFGLSFDNFSQYAEQGNTREHKSKLNKLRSNAIKMLSVLFSEL